MINKPKAVAGPFKEVVEGPTSHGGAFVVTYYFDSRYKPVVKERATRAIVHEYDEKSRSVYRDYLTLDKGNPIVRKPSQRPKKGDAAKKQDEMPTPESQIVSLAAKAESSESAAKVETTANEIVVLGQEAPQKITAADEMNLTQ